MKTKISAIFLSMIAQSVVAAPPVITVTTPASNQGSYLIIVGTATDTAETGSTGEKAARAGVKEVRYQVEGSKKWKRAQLTAKNSTPSGWLFEYDNTSTVGKRITFYAVDRAGLGSQVISTRFKRTTTTVVATPVTGNNTTTTN